MSKGDSRRAATRAWITLIAALGAPAIAGAQVVTPLPDASTVDTAAATVPDAAPDPDAVLPLPASLAEEEPPIRRRLIRLPEAGPSLGCMTAAIAYEAGNQPIAGQQAVGQVILNRMRDPRFPKSVCGVVFDGSERATGCQFTFTCDGSLRRRLSDVTLLTARAVAASVLTGAAPNRVGGATNYHADYVQPYWAATGTRVAQIGAHIFYRMPGGGPRTAMTTPRPAAAQRRGLMLAEADRQTPNRRGVPR